MLIYLLLVIFVIILSVIAFGLTIGGLIKKRRKIWIPSLASFTVLILLTVLFSVIYAKKSIDYMGSAEFQMETKKKAENLGKTWGNTASGTAKGLESTLNDDAIAKLAGKGAKIVGKSANAISGGLDETKRKTRVFSDKSIENVGISLGNADELTDSARNSFGLFLEFKNDFDGTLALTAFNSEGVKKDVSKILIKEKAGNGKVYVFKFEYFQPGPNGYCVLKTASIK